MEEKSKETKNEFIGFIKDQKKVIGIVLIVIVLGYILAVTWKSTEKSDPIVALRAIHFMYDFESVEELDAQMDALKVLVTENVYNQLTIDRTERALRVYLKFNNKPSHVHIVSADKGYIIYKLETDSISAERLFLFKYTTDGKGKIDSVYEAEILEFPTSQGGLK